MKMYKCSYPKCESSYMLKTIYHFICRPNKELVFHEVDRIYNFVYVYMELYVASCTQQSDWTDLFSVPWFDVLVWDSVVVALWDSL